MGAIIMLGTLFSLIAIIFFLVFKFDPDWQQDADLTGNNKRSDGKPYE